MLKPLRSMSPASVRLALNLMGLAVLLTGLGSAAVILHEHQGDRQSRGDQAVNPAAPLAPSDSRKQSRQVEIYYGKSGVLFERWAEKLQTLSQGKPLAWLIVVVSTITAFGCFFAAARLQG